MSVDPKTQIFKLGNFPQGLMSSSVNIFEFPQTALTDGQNVELGDGMVRTRPGSSIMSTGSLPAGEVMALAQVRFPTDEVSYLVAQVKYRLNMQKGAENGPTARYGHSAVWDEGNARMLVFGGADGPAGTNELWAYDPATDIWTELTPTGGPPHARRNHSAIYDPSSEAMIIFGGTYGVGPATYLNDVWYYNCSANTWAEISYTATPPSVRAYALAVLRSTDHTMIVIQGEFDLDVHVLNLDTWAWTAWAYTSTPDPIGGKFPYASSAGVYDPIHDSLVIVGGQYAEDVGSFSCYTLNLTTHNWTQNLDVPHDIDDASGMILNRAVYCSGQMHVCGDYGATIAGSDIHAWTYNIAGNTWTEFAFAGTTQPAQRSGHSAVLSDIGQLLIFGGHASDAAVWFTDEICGTTYLYGYGLYACPTYLPTTTGTFTLIWQFTSTPGVCTFGPLNDRVVITEGLSDVPLVWPGAMSNDAFDWPHLLHALIAQDGVKMYDVSPQVCDKDPDTVAQIGGIKPWGAIYLCTDMPLVEGFYFDIETPNTGSAGTTANTFHAPMQIDAVADVNRQDLKATIANWVQDAGSAGHFTTGGGTPVTLGPGKVNEDVVPGVIIKFGDVELQMLSQVGDGSGASGVTLSASHANAAVVAIYGLNVSSTGLIVNYQTNAMTSAWSATLNLGNAYGYAGYSIRQVVTLGSGGDHVRLTLKSGSNINIPVGFTASHVSIVPRDTGANGTTTPTEITFNNGGHGCSVGTYQTEVTSDVIPFTTAAGDYIVTIDVAWEVTQVAYGGGTWGAGSFPSTTRAGFLGRNYPPTGTCYFKDPGFGNEEVSWNQQTVTGYEVTTAAIGVDNVEVATLNAVPDNTYVATSASGIQLSAGLWEGIISATPTQTQPGSSVIWWAVSLDGEIIFQVFKSAAWRLIVRNNGGTWQYNNSATTTPNWVNATTNSVYGALRQAFADTHNQMTAAELTAITSAQWIGTGGFVPHISTYFDFAVGMAADGDNVPIVSLLDVVYENAGQAIIEGFKNGAWTSGDGWTDNTIVTNNRLGQSGSITYDGATPFEADYHVVDGIPGYWFRLLTNGTSPTCAITRIRYKAPCQPLANIGDGQPDIALGVIYVDTSTGAIQDITVEMSDNTLTELASALVPMATDDFLYVGYLTQFTEIEATPFADPISTIMTNNQAASVLSAEYWNGESWTTMTITDATAVGGATLAAKGKISWSLPTDWKTSIPFDAFFSRGYWVRFSVSGALTATTALSELRVYGTPDGLVKHKFVASYANRIALGGTQRTPNQVDISRPFEEYGWTGGNTGSFIVGAQDQITCALSAWDGLLISKTQSLHFLKEGASDFETIEAARRTPINTQVVVKAPTTGFDYGENYGLFFINRYGAHVMVGLHTDSVKNTSRGQTVSDVLNFWDTTTTPRIDLDYLHLACGEYWPVRNWICWSVPIIFSGSGPQATNNALMVYDLNLQAWLPLFVFPFGIASLTSAYHYNANASGKLGSMGLYAGDYAGRVIRLFDTAATTDVGTVIDGSIETGWLDFDAPEMNKWLRNLYLYGTSTGDSVTLQVLRNGAITPEAQDVFSITGMSELTDKLFTTGETSFSHRNIPGTMFKLRLDFTGQTTIYAIQVGVQGDRDWPRT